MRMVQIVYVREIISYSRHTYTLGVLAGKMGGKVRRRRDSSLQ